MEDVEIFEQLKKNIKIDKNYVRRNYETIGGMWTVDTWENNGIIYQLMDEGATGRLFLKDELDVLSDYHDKLTFQKGNMDTLKKLLKDNSEE